MINIIFKGILLSSLMLSIGIGIGLNIKEVVETIEIPPMSFKNSDSVEMKSMCAGLSRIELHKNKLESEYYPNKVEFVSLSDRGIICHVSGILKIRDTNNRYIEKEKSIDLLIDPVNKIAEIIDYDLARRLLNSKVINSLASNNNIPPTIVKKLKVIVLK